MMITMMVNRVMIKVIVVCSDYVNLGKNDKKTHTKHSFCTLQCVYMMDACIIWYVCEYFQKISQQRPGGQSRSRTLCVEDVPFASEVTVSCIYSSQYSVTASHDRLLRRHFSSQRYIVADC